MYTYEHPRPALSVDIVIFSIRAARLHLLLIQRKQEPFTQMWALPGGFVYIDEPLEEAAARELEEETGLRDIYLEQLYTYGDPHRDPRERIVTVAYFAFTPVSVSIRSQGGDDADQARWFPVDELPNLAFDHSEIITDGLHRLKNKLESNTISLHLLPDAFALTELQHIYEIILGVTTPPRKRGGF